LGLFLFGLSPKRNKKNTLCDLCVSSEAGGESMSFSLIIFDYDGVLIDSLADAISAGREFCRAVSHDRMPTQESIGALEIMTYPAIARSVGLTPAQAEGFCSHVFQCFEAIGPAMKFFPEMESLLHRMAARNIAIVSGNSRNVISAKLAAHHLAENIPCILGALEPGDKGDKICKACRYFGIAAGRACMVGDSVSDIRYAKRAGVQSIAATWGWQSRDMLVRENPDFIVNSVRELAALLDSQYSPAEHIHRESSNG
jgi:phosphoglycolate phosphatase